MHEDESPKQGADLNKQLTLSENTQEKVRNLLGKTPTQLELAVFSFLEIDEKGNSIRIKIREKDKKLRGFSESKLSTTPIDKPAYLKNAPKFSTKKINSPKKVKDAAKQFFLAPTIIKQFSDLEKMEDAALKTRTCADILPLKEMENVLTIASVSNAEQIYADPYRGAMIGVIRSIRKVICSGSTPLGIVPFLTFEDLENPEVSWQFLQIKKGIEEVSHAFDLPILGSEITIFSKENASNSKEFLLKPVIHTVGQLKNVENQIPKYFQDSGDLIYMLGNAQNDLAGSEYVRFVKETELSPCPHIELQETMELNRHLLKIIDKNIPVSMSEIGRGGLFINLMENAVTQGLGFNIETVHTYRRDAFLFGESQNRVVLTIEPEKENELLNYLITHNISFAKLGEVFGNEVVIDGENYGTISDWKAHHLNNTAIEVVEHLM